ALRRPAWRVIPPRLFAQRTGRQPHRLRGEPYRLLHGRLHGAGFQVPRRDPQGQPLLRRPARGDPRRRGFLPRRPATRFIRPQIRDPPAPVRRDPGRPRPTGRPTVVTLVSVTGRSKRAAVRARRGDEKPGASLPRPSRRWPPLDAPLPRP